MSGRQDSQEPALSAGLLALLPSGFKPAPCSLCESFTPVERWVPVFRSHVSLSFAFWCEYLPCQDRGS